MYQSEETALRHLEWLIEMMMGSKKKRGETERSRAQERDKIIYRSFLFLCFWCSYSLFALNKSKSSSKWKKIYHMEVRVHRNRNNRFTWHLSVISFVGEMIHLISFFSRWNFCMKNLMKKLTAKGFDSKIQKFIRFDDDAS